MTDLGRPRTNWPLVVRHVIPAIYVPVVTLIAYGAALAVTGTSGLEHVEAVGFAVTGSSFVLVFARLASRDADDAVRNVAALAAVCFVVVAFLGALGGGWRDPRFLPALPLAAIVLGLAAVVGLRWARRWERWRSGAG